MTIKQKSSIASIVIEARKAQSIINDYSQEQIDELILAVAWEVIQPENNQKLSEMAVKHTGLGNVEDKMRKNRRKTIGLLRDLKGVKTVGVINQDIKKGLTEIEEMYAIGPAISILMDGYIESKKLVSLRGTLVPATTINRSIASIPLLGKILIGDKTGEGVFGVSFKIKGPPKNLSTTVNPIKTLTPRFITRTLEKIKKN